MPIEPVTDALRALLSVVLDAAGLEGIIGAGALVTILMWLYTGWKLTGIAAAIRGYLGVVSRYGGVSALLVVLAAAGAVHLGVLDVGELLTDLGGLVP